MQCYNEKLISLDISAYLVTVVSLQVTDVSAAACKWWIGGSHCSWRHAVYSTWTVS